MPAARQLSVTNLTGYNFLYCWNMCCSLSCWGFDNRFLCFYVMVVVLFKSSFRSCREKSGFFLYFNPCVFAPVDGTLMPPRVKERLSIRLWYHRMFTEYFSQKDNFPVKRISIQHLTRWIHSCLRKRLFLTFRKKKKCFLSGSISKPNPQIDQLTKWLPWDLFDHHGASKPSSALTPMVTACRKVM